MKGNIHKKVTFEDKFSRKHRCYNSRLRQLRIDKKHQKKVFRQWRKNDDSDYR